MAETPRREWPTDSLLAQLRPEPGWELDRACIASYSADLRVVAAALLALSGAGAEPESGSRTQLIQALQNLSGRVAFVVQRGRVQAARSLPQAAALLDRFLFDANCDEREQSWHPKFAVMRWKRPSGGGTAWRVWIGSRNLTRDLSRDVGLLLRQATDDGEGTLLSGLRWAVEGLQSKLPHSVRLFKDSELNTLARVRWRLPRGVNTMRIFWLDGRGSGFPKVEAPQQEVIVVTPFVDAGGLRQAKAWSENGTKPIVLSAESQLASACTDPKLLHSLDLRTCSVGIEEGTCYETPAPHARADATETEREVDRSEEAAGYHAKLIYMRRGRARRLWVGSPNLTNRAWSRNFEIAAELHSDGVADPWGPLLRQIAHHATEFEPPSASLPADAETAEVLEQARKVLSAEFRCHQERRHSVVTLFGTHWPESPAPGIELLVALPWDQLESRPWQWGQAQVSLGPVELAACSNLLEFLLRRGDEQTQWIMRAPFRPALDGRRDSAAIASYLGPEGYLALIRAQLEPESAADVPWDTLSPTKRGRGVLGRREVALPTLEGLLRLFLREPGRLAAVKRTVETLQEHASKWHADSGVSDDAKANLSAFEQLWREVGETLASRVNDNEA
jgi:hypothetical protein